MSDALKRAFTDVTQSEACLAQTGIGNHGQAWSFDLPGFSKMNPCAAADIWRSCDVGNWQVPLDFLVDWSYRRVMMMMMGCEHTLWFRLEWRMSFLNLSCFQSPNDPYRAALLTTMSSRAKGSQILGRRCRCMMNGAVL